MSVIARNEAISRVARLNKIATSLSLLAMTKLLVSLRGTKQSFYFRVIARYEAIPQQLASIQQIATLRSQ